MRSGFLVHGFHDPPFGKLLRNLARCRRSNDDHESVFLELEVNSSAELCVDDVYTSAFLCTRVFLEDQIVFCLKQLWFFIELLQEYFNHSHDRILNLLHEDQDWFVPMC